MSVGKQKPTQGISDSPTSAHTPATEADVRMRVLTGHKGEVWRTAMPNDGSFALTSGEDGTVRKWRLDVPETNSQIVFTHTAAFFGLAVTADGNRAAAGSTKGTIHLIDLPSARMLLEWQGHEKILGDLAFLAESGKLLSAGQDGYLRRWDEKTGALISECHFSFESLLGVAASADGTRIVAAALQEGFAVWPEHESDEPVAFNENIASFSPVALSADGRFVFTGTSEGKVVQWSLIEGRRVAAFEGHSNEVSAVTLTPDGRFCVSGGGDHSVRLWAAETGQCLAILREHTGWITDVAITPDGSRIASVSEDGTLRVWDIPQSILARADAARKRGYMNAKVVLLGESGVGKSGLALRLWHDRWKKTESSHGLEIQRLQLPPADEDGDIEREVWLWDLAGQPDYRLTHQLFMEQTSLALLVFDPQDAKVFDTVAYWQGALRKVARVGQVAGILVAARCDRPGLRLTLDEVKEWAAARGLHGPILTAAKLKTHPGAADLRALIAELLPWDQMEFRSTMDNFPALKDAILAVRDRPGAGGVVVKPEELEARVRQAMPQLEFVADDLRAVTGLLAGEGVLHKLPYGDLVVLQPSWVNCYASTLVKLAGEAEDHLGHVALSTIQPGQLPADGTPRLSLDDERQLLPALVALFLQRALVWKQDTDRGAMLVFPNYVRLPRPEPPPRPGHTVLYRFTGPLEEIYCTLVVRLHYSGLFSRSKLYRQAADFYTASGKMAALTMRETGELGELEIYFGVGLDVDLQASFQRFVHDHLEAKASGLQRLRNYFCPQCRREAKDREALDTLIAEGVKEMACQYCFFTKKGTILLNDVLEQQFTSNQGEAGADRAGRKAGAGISTASMEQVMVGEVMSIVASADQAFIQRVVRDEGTDGEIEFYSADGKSTGVAFRVQLKSGDSHLTTLKDGTEKFALKPHYERYWSAEKAAPVLLIIRTADGRTRYMNATQAIRTAQESKPGKPVKQIIFSGEDFTREAVLRLRDERLK